MLKLSLVAALAAGALATSASAVPLEEAIKDVDVSGFLRLRYTAVKNKDDKQKRTTEGAWNIKSVIDFKSKIDDNFFAVAGVRYGNHGGATEYGFNGGKGNFGKDTYANTADDQFDLYRAYIGYTVGGTTIQLGRQNVFSFFTDDMYGDGLFVLNSDIPGLTLGALWMDALEQDGDIGVNTEVDEKGTQLGDVVKKATGKKLTEHDLYGIGVIGSYDPFSFQVWHAYLQDVAGLTAVELALDFNVSDDIAFGVKGQYGHAELDKDLKALTDDSNFWGIEGSTSLFGVDLSTGYVRYTTKEGKYSLTSFEDNGMFIGAGEDIYGYSAYIGKNYYWYLTAAYTIPNSGVTFGADYAIGKFDKEDKSEVVARVNYKYNEKLNFKSWYSYLDKEEGYDTKFRFEAKYSF